MIVFSAFLVVVAVGVLVAGVVTSKLILVYAAIAISGVALLSLGIGTLAKRRELFGEPESAQPRLDESEATPPQAAQFLTQVRRMLGSGSQMIVGVDLRKDKAILDAAYNDAAGVTAAFNLNLLARINRELEGDFDLDQFEHRAFYEPEQGRIEMHLVSRKRQTVTVAGRNFVFERGETIHTENSYKYDIERFRSLAVSTGWSHRSVWTDSDRLFSVHLLGCE